MLLHAVDGATHGSMKILLRTVDSHVVLLSISFTKQFDCDYLQLVMISVLHSLLSMLLVAVM